MSLFKLSRALSARILGSNGERIDKKLREFKEKIFNGISGDVVEIGPGSGVNFRYFPRNIRYVGIEPNQAFHSGILESAKRCGMYNVEVKEGIAEKLPLTSESQDAVVSGMVLCSVDNQQTVLQEIYRVLKPGGTFYFVEHVGAPPKTFRRTIQKVIKPVCLWCGDGCRPDCDTNEAICSAGFRMIVMHLYSIPYLPLAPFIIGKAIK